MWKWYLGAAIGVYDYLKTGRDVFEYTCTNKPGQQFSTMAIRGSIHLLNANLENGQRNSSVSITRSLIGGLKWHII